MLGLLAGDVLVPGFEPVGQTDGAGGAEHGPAAPQQGEGDGAVGVLGAGGLHKVDGGVAHKVGHEQVVGLVIHSEGGVVLLEHAVVDETDLSGQGHGLHLVVGDIDEGRARLHVESLKLIAHLQAELGVQVGQRLIHEQHGGLRGQGAGDGHPLLLAAGQLGGIAVHEHADLHDAGDPAHRQVDLLLRQLPLFHHGLAVLHHPELVVQGLVLLGGGHLAL